MPRSHLVDLAERLPDEMRGVIIFLTNHLLAHGQDPMVHEREILEILTRDEPAYHLRMFTMTVLRMLDASVPAIPEQRSAEPYLFRMLALALPRRLWEEELGDALEVLHALRKSQAPRWQIQVKIFSTFAWSLVNALREVMSAVTGQAREREK